MRYLFIADAENAVNDIISLKAAFGTGNALILNCSSDKILLPEGLETIFFLNYADAISENYTIAESIEAIIRQKGIERVCFAGRREQNSAAALLAARLGLDFYPDIREVKSERDRLILRRRVYSGNIEAEFSLKGPAVLTLAESNAKKTAALCEYSPMRLSEGKDAPWLIKTEFERSRGENGLKNARILFAAGKGIGSRENYVRLKASALALGASVGATRAVILSGWAPVEDMIGQSGSICSPKLCVCFGVSGAAPFLAGVEQAETLIAINTDPSASIFSAADTGIIADCREVLQELEKLTLK